jgi:hypothetical protein
VQVLRIADSGPDQARFTEAPPDAEQQRMPVGLPQLGSGVACQDAGIGAQCLRLRSVAFDFWPGCQQSVGGGACEWPPVGRGQAFAGGALDETVHADGPVWGGGVEVGQAEPVQTPQCVGRILGIHLAVRIGVLAAAGVTTRSLTGDSAQVAE